MVKTFLSGLIGLLIMVTASFFEYGFVKNSFLQFHEILTVAYDKIEDETAVKDDVQAAQEFWIEKKKSLHVFIPHNDIKEIDLWVSEAVTLVENKNPVIREHTGEPSAALNYDLFTASSDLEFGYCTQDEEHWVCETCYRDFKDLFKWKIE